MTEFMKTQNSFADGEVSAEFFIRDNLNGLSRLENMDVIAGGGLRRRRGLQSFATLNSSGRLIPFSVSESENYLLALIDGHLKIYNNSELVRDLLVIWDFADIEKIHQNMNDIFNADVKQLSAKEMKKLKHSYMEYLLNNSESKDQKHIKSLIQYCKSNPNSTGVKAEIVKLFNELQYKKYSGDIIDEFWKLKSPELNIEYGCEY